MQQIWASEAGQWAVLAATAIAFAFFAWGADLRRARRRYADDVGFMPWGPLFLLALGVAGLAAFVALQFWLAPV